MADSGSTNIPQFAPSQGNLELRVNEIFAAASPATVYGVDPNTTANLTFGWIGGRWGGFSVANGSSALTASTTQYMVVAIANGAPTFSTGTTNWNDAANYARAYKITLGASSLTYEDHRAGPRGTNSMASAGAASITESGLSLSDVTTDNVSITAHGFAPKLPNDAAKYLNGAGGYTVPTGTGVGTVTSVGITAPAAGITSSGGPITSSGSVTLALANDLAAVEGLAATGIVRRTATDTWSAGTAVNLTSEVTGILPIANIATGTPSGSKFVRDDGVLAAPSGTVSSVALTAPGIISVAGSPITSSGTLALTLATQAANLVFAGPASGAAAAPTFRALVAADVPSSGGGSLTNWAEAVSTSSPNDTIPAVSFAASNAATNVDAVLKPKGTGAILAQIPDSTTTGGSKRGANSIDLQTVRTANTQVASGAGAVTLGRSNSASANDAVAMGSATSASGIASFATGMETVATGKYSLATGYRSNTRGVIGMQAHASYSFSVTNGGGQAGRFVLYGTCYDSSPVVMTADTNTAGSSNTILVPSGFVISFAGQVVAKDHGTNDVSCWKFEGMAKRTAGAGTTALIGTVTPALIAQDSGASLWTFAIAVNTTIGALQLTATSTPAGGQWIEWCASVQTIEVT